MEGLSANISLVNKQQTTMTQDEKQKELKKLVNEKVGNLGYFGLHIRIEVDDPIGDKELYIIRVNDEIFADACLYDEVLTTVDGIVFLYKTFMKVPAPEYKKILYDRETNRIKGALESWIEHEYTFAPEGMDDEDEYYACPCVMAHIDELQTSDNNYFPFYVHKVELDENKNIKLTGRIAGPDRDVNDELWTYLHSVDAFDLEEIYIPLPGESEPETEEEPEIEEETENE